MSAKAMCRITWSSAEQFRWKSVKVTSGVNAKSFARSAPKITENKIKGGKKNVKSGLKCCTK